MRQLGNSGRNPGEAVEVTPAILDRFLNDTREVTLKRREQLATLLHPDLDHAEFSFSGSRLFLDRQPSGYTVELRDAGPQGGYAIEGLSLVRCRAQLEGGQLFTLEVARESFSDHAFDSVSGSGQIPPALRILDSYLSEAVGRELVLRERRVNVLRELFEGQNRQELFGHSQENISSVVALDSQTVFVVSRLFSEAAVIEGRYAAREYLTEYSDDSTLHSVGRWGFRVNVELQGSQAGAVSNVEIIDRTVPYRESFTKVSAPFLAIEKLDQDFFNPLSRDIALIKTIFGS